MQYKTCRELAHQLDTSPTWTANSFTLSFWLNGSKRCSGSDSRSSNSWRSGTLTNRGLYFDCIASTLINIFYLFDESVHLPFF